MEQQLLLFLLLSFLLTIISLFSCFRTKNSSILNPEEAEKLTKDFLGKNVHNHTDMLHYLRANYLEEYISTYQKIYSNTFYEIPLPTLKELVCKKSRITGMAYTYKFNR